MQNKIKRPTTSRPHKNSGHSKKLWSLNMTKFMNRHSHVKVETDTRRKAFNNNVLPMNNDNKTTVKPSPVRNKSKLLFDQDEVDYLLQNYGGTKVEYNCKDGMLGLTSNSSTVNT